MPNQQWYAGGGPEAIVRHISTQETYPARILEVTELQYIFELTGERAHRAIVLCQSDDLIIDTYFEQWEILKIRH